MSTLKGSGVTRRPIGAHLSLAAIEQLDLLAARAGTSRSGAIEMLVIAATIQLESADQALPTPFPESQPRFDAVAARFRERSIALAASGA